jgi:hypothetical protein
MKCTRLPLFTFSLFLAGLPLGLCPAPVQAGRTQGIPIPSISIVQPSIGVPVYYDPLNGNVTSFYDPATETVQVSGAFSDVPSALIRSQLVGVVINGDTANPVQFILFGGRVVRGKRYWNGFFQTEVYLVNDLRWPVRNVTAELVNLKSGKTLARAVTTFWDLRSLRDATPYYDREYTVLGMRAQLTDRGLGHLQTDDEVTGLESLVLPLLPQPDLASFNRDLTDEARSTPRYDDDGKILNDCVGYEHLAEPRFSNELEFGPYASALAQAALLYGAYTAQRDSCNSIPDLVLRAACLVETELQHCVKSEPQASDFELCVDQVEAEVTGLTIGGVSEVRHRFLNAARTDRGRIEAHVSLDSLRGTTDAYLRSLTVRWKNSLCVPRPSAGVDDTLIQEPGKEWLRDWTTCRDLEVNNQAATTVSGEPAVYLATGDETQIERLRVGLGNPGTFDFLGPNLDARKDVCGEDWIRPDVADAIRTFRPALQQALQTTWYAGQPDTQEAAVLTKALLPFKLGETELADHDIFGGWSIVDSMEVGGLKLNWRNLTSTANPTAVPNLKEQWFLAPPVVDPYAPDGQDHTRGGRKFDVAYTVTTGMLNSVLHTRSAFQETLHFVFRPTWGELQAIGVETPAGADPDEPALLDRQTLVQISPAFRGLPPGKSLELRVKPIWNPIVHMAPDLDPEEAAAEGRGPYDMPLNYGIPILEVAFKSPDQVRGAEVREGRIWLRLTGGFSDRYFRLDFGETFLRPSLVDDRWGFVVRDNVMLGCPMWVRDATHPFTCEGELEDKVAELMKNRLRDTFLEMLTQIPVPYRFDLDGAAAPPYVVGLKSQEQVGQNVTYFGDFEFDR